MYLDAMTQILLAVRGHGSLKAFGFVGDGIDPALVEHVLHNVPHL